MWTAEAVIVGGGIQGCSMALAAIQRGIRPTIIERDGPGAGASGSSYGIVHGGLRYLQSLDVGRWRRSRRALRWYLSRYPGQVRPLRCVMPLYRGRLRSPPLFAAARAAERGLARLLAEPSPVPPGGLLTREAVEGLYPVVRRGLAGAATWYDAELLDATGLLEAMLEAARRGGATVLRGHEAQALEVVDGAVRGIFVRDRATDRAIGIDTPMVIDCAGSAVGDWTGLAPRRPSTATLAFNVALRIAPPPPATAIALSPDPGRGRSYFLRERRGATYAGTFYRPCLNRAEARVTERDVALAVQEIARCVPDMAITRDHVDGIDCALLPDTDGSGVTLDSRDHHLRPGPRGYSLVLGGKLTTAPLLSEEVASLLWPQRRTATIPVPALRHA